MTGLDAEFMSVLSAALRGEDYPCTENGDQLLTAAGRNGVLPLISHALFFHMPAPNTFYLRARELTVGQALQTADFLLLLKRLEERGLRPVVVKGIVCRSLYPEPELRYSADEDLLIRPEDKELYASALAAEGYCPEEAQEERNDAYEFRFRGRDSQLLVELHTSLFPEDSEAYGDCSRFFADVLDHTAETEIEGLRIRTLAPTDHLLYLICHAYKHLLHSGIAIRQLCDIVLMTERFRSEIDWDYIRSSCDSLQISHLCAAIFRIGEKYLGYSMPEAFADCEAEETHLLEDILSGARFGQDDPDRAHSSTMTLEAVSADRSGRRRKGILRSVFLPLKAMQGRFPYLIKHPWLLPAAWAQRVFRYLTRKDRPDPISPARSIRFARERVELLREYKIIR